MMKIRRMREWDLDAVEQLAAASAPQTAVWTRPQLLNVLADSSLYEAWVAEEADSVVGFLYFHLVGEEAELDNLAVATAWRRRSIASHLLETAWQQACGRGATAMYLEVRRSNSPALWLYERSGFIPVGTRANYYTNPTEDAIRLVRKRL